MNSPQNMEKEITAMVADFKEIHKEILPPVALEKGAAWFEKSLTIAYSLGEKAMLEKAAKTVETWHIKKGGLTELAHVIRSLTSH